MKDEFELKVERRIDADPAAVWAIMTDRLAEWWCPKPWTTDVEEIDWRPGGRSAMTMRGPDGEAFPNEGVVLEFVPGRRWVSTDAFKAGWIPAEPFMVGTWEVVPHEGGSVYRASARHWTAEARDKHVAMGFKQGWGAVADQLKTLAEAEARRKAA